MRKKAEKTPLRGALVPDSRLGPLVLTGLSAVEQSHRSFFDVAIRPAIADSLDLDAAFLDGHEQEHRWDYLIGHLPSGQLVAIEPHSARQDEISTLIKKRNAARKHLKGHLREGVRVVKWLWVASGKVHFADTEKAKFLLNQNGTEFVGSKIHAKHMPFHSVSYSKE